MSLQKVLRPSDQAVTARWRARTSRLGVLVVLAMLQACTAVPNKDPRDPMESWNRSVFSFNDSVDRAVVKPVATAYQRVLPHWVRTGINNFFTNLDDVWSLVNNALQLRGQATADSFGRVMVNSTMGLGGILDVAGEMGMERHSANFGLTLGRWGVGPGPFVVLPLLGSSTLRDTLALPIDTKGNLVNSVKDVPTRDALTILNVVDTRATYLKAGDVVDGAALDKYSFTRDAFLQRRRNQVYDGNPPDEDTTSAYAEPVSAPPMAPASAASAAR
ncbi:MAG: VacJ family lipoprotein [Pseudomonadota bacterium]